MPASFDSLGVDGIAIVDVYFETDLAIEKVSEVVSRGAGNAGIFITLQLAIGDCGGYG